MSGTLIQSEKHIPIGAPRDEASPDGSRWVSVSKDILRAPAGNPWKRRVQMTQSRHTTTTYAPRGETGDPQQAVDNPSSLHLGGNSDTPYEAPEAPEILEDAVGGRMAPGAGSYPTYLGPPPQHSEEDLARIKKRQERNMAYAAAHPPLGPTRGSGGVRGVAGGAEYRESKRRAIQQRSAKGSGGVAGGSAHVHFADDVEGGEEDEPDDEDEPEGGALGPPSTWVHKATHAVKSAGKQVLGTAALAALQAGQKYVQSAMQGSGGVAGGSEVCPTCGRGPGLGPAADGAPLVGKRKRAPVHPDSAAARRRAKVRELMQTKGMGMAEASSHIKQHGIQY
jgi:hypothetical protein